MHNLTRIIDDIRDDLEQRNEARDEALKRSRKLIRLCSLSIRACHRHEFDEASNLLEQVRQQGAELRELLADYPELFHAGYTQDALKELVEAHLVYAMIHHETLPTPAELSVPHPAYLGGLAEAASEMRRFILDLLRRDRLQEAETYFSTMDDVYSVLVTIDFPDAITGGLRRQTDILRSVTERTRGDLTLTLRQHRLEQAIRQLEENSL